MRVAVIGANGQLGTDVVRALGEAGGYETRPLTHDEIEVTLGMQRADRGRIPGRLDVGEARTLQHRARDAAIRLLVVHDQDAGGR